MHSDDTGHIGQAACDNTAGTRRDDGVLSALVAADGRRQPMRSPGNSRPTLARPWLRAMGLHLLMLCQFGCGTASTAGDGWSYQGNNAALRSPLPVFDSSQSPEQRLKRAQESLDAWKQTVSDALAADKKDCARETGEAAAPDVLSGYGKAFEACMRSRGWQRASNPL